MKELVNLRLPKKLGAFVEARAVLDQSVQARGTLFMNVSAYPQGSAAVGRIQQMIKLGSYRELMESCKKIRDLSRLAYDIINTNTLMRVDKMPLNRTELLAYIELQTEEMNMPLSFEERDLVAYLIISSDAAEGSWTLDFASDDNNLWRKFHALYKSVRDAGSFSTNDVGEINDPSPDVNVIYNSELDAIEPLALSKRIKDLAAETARGKKGKTTPEEDKERQVKINALNDTFRHTLTIHSLASLRVIDHVLCLLTDIDTWKAFISPRKTVDPAANVERAKSLRLMSSYFHSLLMYQQIYALEFFMGTYNKLQTWIMTFPPLPEHINVMYQMSVKKFDVLDAASDVAKVLGLLDEGSNNPSGSSIVGIPVEAHQLFGLSDTYNTVRDAESKAITPILIDKLKELKDPKYAYYLLNHPVVSFNITIGLTRAITIGEVVAGQIRMAATGVLNGVPRFYSDEVLSRLIALSPRVPFGYSAKVPLVDSVFSTTSASVEGGKLNYTDLTPAHTYDFEYKMRHDKLLEVFKGSSIVSGDDDFRPKVIINRDSAKRLRGVMHRDFKSLYPTKVVYGDYVYNSDMFARTQNAQARNEQLKRLFETLTGTNYNIVKEEIGAEFIRQAYATYLSSFALLYVAPADLMATKNESEAVAAIVPYLVTGHGLPYGVEYSALANKQPSPKFEEFIQVTPNVYIRFLKRVPEPTEELRISDDFYMQHPYYYYPGNSKHIDVEGWLVEEGLLHMALAPITKRVTKPFILLDTRYGYLNDRLIMQTQLNFSISSSANGDESFGIPMSKKEWPFDRFKYNIEMIGFGGYSTSTISAAAVETTEVTKIVENIEEQMKQAESQSTPARTKDASTDALHNPTITEIKSDNKGGGSKKEEKKKEEPKKPKKKDDAGDDTDGEGDDKIAE